jgi:nitrate/TMAO reductase-like tetraheme cytochrome c subunit
MVTKRTKRVLVIAAIAVPVVLIGSAFVAAEATRSNSFCGTTCHEMLPYDATWAASTHNEVDCVQCHIPPGVVNYVKTKAFGLREVWVHFTNKNLAPIAVTRQIPNVVCTDCHPASDTSQPLPLTKATKPFHHTGHGEVPACIDCHAQVVHHPIPGVDYVEVQSMDACFTCHDGKTEPDACRYCHISPHTGAGPTFTKCEDCHTLKTWSGAEHPSSSSDCTQCHDPGPLHNGLSTQCAQCHDTGVRWTPATFQHQQVGPHVPSGDELLQCVQCHTATYANATCSCHGGNPPAGGG